MSQEAEVSKEEKLAAAASGSRPRKGKQVLKAGLVNDNNEAPLASRPSGPLPSRPPLAPTLSATSQQGLYPVLSNPQPPLQHRISGSSIGQLRPRRSRNLSIQLLDAAQQQLAQITEGHSSDDEDPFLITRRESASFHTSSAYTARRHPSEILNSAPSIGYYESDPGLIATRSERRAANSAHAYHALSALGRSVDGLASQRSSHTRISGSGGSGGSGPASGRFSTANRLVQRYSVELAAANADISRRGSSGSLLAGLSTDTTAGAAATTARAAVVSYVLNSGPLSAYDGSASPFGRARACEQVMPPNTPKPALKRADSKKRLGPKKTISFSKLDTGTVCAVRQSSEAGGCVEPDAGHRLVSTQSVRVE